MPRAGRIRTHVRAGLLATAALAVVFAPAALPRAGSADASALAAAVLAPSDGRDAWRPIVPQERTDDVGLVLLAVAAAAAVVAAPRRWRARASVAVARSSGSSCDRPPSERAPPLLVVV